MNDQEGPFIVWQYIDYEGWWPSSFKTLDEAILSKKFENNYVITQRIRLQNIKISSDD